MELHQKKKIKKIYFFNNNSFVRVYFGLFCNLFNIGAVAFAVHFCFRFKKRNILFFSRKLTLPLFLPSRVTLYYAAICIVSSSCPRVDLHILAAVYERISNRVLFFSLKVEAFSCWALLIYQLETVTRPINGIIKLLFTHNYFFFCALKVYPINSIGCEFKKKLRVNQFAHTVLFFWGGF